MDDSCVNRREGEKRWRIIDKQNFRLREDHPLGLVLVGSVARGECEASSDIDLIVVSDDGRKYPDDWIEGIPVTFASKSMPDIREADDILKSELLKGIVLYDPQGLIDQTIQGWRKELALQKRSESDLKLDWCHRISEECYAQSLATSDPYSKITFLRESCYYILCHFLLRNSKVWKPRAKDLSRYQDNSGVDIEEIMSFIPFIAKATTIQDLFEAFEGQLLGFLERNRSRISSGGLEFARNCASVHKSRLPRFYMNNGDWFSGIFGYRNYLNRIYAYPIAEAHSTEPTDLTTLMGLTDPPAFRDLCRAVNCFEEREQAQLLRISERYNLLRRRLRQSLH